MIEAATRAFPDKSKALYDIGKVYERPHPRPGDGHRLLRAGHGHAPGERRRRHPPRGGVLERPPLGARRAPARPDHGQPARAGLPRAAAAALPHRPRAERLQKDDKALHHYKQAYELDSTHLPTLQGMGNLLFRRRGLGSRVQDLPDRCSCTTGRTWSPRRRRRDLLPPGADQAEGGRAAQGPRLLQEGPRHRPEHLETLQAMVALHEAQGDWEDVIHYRRQMLALTRRLDRFQAQVGIGDILHEQMRNARLAVEAYNEALRSSPAASWCSASCSRCTRSPATGTSRGRRAHAARRAGAEPERKSKYFYTWRRSSRTS
jgi:tetratricopeptide (TPR) repeat protein